MSIGAALSNAYSGLTANSRLAEIISSNVANALNENYSRRSVELSANSVGGKGAGVKVDAIIRFEDAVAVSLRRGADADSALSSVLASGYAKLGTALGQPGEGGSLPTMVVGFEAALVAAAATPESGPMQANLLRAATGLVTTVTNISTENQRIRMDADAEISRQVEVVNSALGDIDQLNREIQMQVAGGNDASALMDQRKHLIDKIAGILPIKSIRRDDGQVALFTNSGAQLLDGNRAQLQFTATNLITPDMNVASGTLSGLSLNGVPVPIGFSGGLLDGGSLSANFALRDVIVPEADRRLDAFSADLMQRFESTALDPSITPGMPGLFTDAGAALNPADTEGLASRLKINANVDPTLGGALWHLRDGLYAATAGNAGFGIILVAMRNAVTQQQIPPIGSGVAGSVNLGEFAADIVSQNGVAAQNANEKYVFNAARAATFRESEISGAGVDTDYEMQQLMLVEQAYAANARVVSVIDNLLQTLMEM